MYFPPEEYETRWSRLYEEMRRRGYHTAVIWQRTGGGYDRAGNVWYLANYASHNIGQEPAASGVGCAFAALIAHNGREPELHILQPDYSTMEEVESRYVAVDRIACHEDNLAVGVAARLRELGIQGPVAYDGDDFLPAQMYRALLAQTPGIEWVPEDDLVFALQNDKSPRELDVYREAGEISSQALTAFTQALIRGERQSDAAARAAEIIVRHGGGFQRLGCHAGPHGDDALWDYPLYGYSRAAPKTGELVRAWVIGPILEGYWLDPGRSSVCGLQPSAGQRRLLEDAAQLTTEIAAAIRPGRTPRELGALGDRLVRDRGYQADPGCYGHGLATFWLGPVIPAGSALPADENDSFFGLDVPFHEGQIITSEVFLRDPGAGLAAFEDIFIVGADKNELLTTTPLIFW
jgi:Xaa-Pro dipeptidase